MERRVYTPTRRELLTLFGTTILAACSRGPEGSSGAQPGVIPDKGPSVSTIETQSKQSSLDYFYKLLSSSQSSPDGNATLTSKITNNARFPTNEIIQGKQVPQDSDLLQVKWVYSEPSWPSGVEKTTGQAEFKNFKIKALIFSTITDADRANGIQSRWETQIGFINRYRLTKPEFFDNGYFIDSGPEKAWAKVTIPEPTIPFSQWKDGNLSILLQSKNGTLINSQGILYPTTYKIALSDCQFSRQCEVTHVPMDALK